jgi:hypothetical protein
MEEVCGRRGLKEWPRAKVVCGIWRAGWAARSRGARTEARWWKSKCGVQKLRCRTVGDSVMVQYWRRAGMPEFSRRRTIALTEQASG